MTGRAPALVVFACPLCGHEIGGPTDADAWCVRRADHPPRTGPVLMLPKHLIHPEKETHR